VLFAWAVHVYTACGAVLALAMAMAIINDRYRTAFFLMVAATAIDGTDGALARLARVKEATPDFDGARLDDIVDYLTYAFVPALLLVHAQLIAPGWGGGVAAAILLSSAYGFAVTDAKTDDHFFTGFPSYWNIAALYLFAAKLPPVLNSVILLVLSVLVFVRIGYIYPSRTPVLRGLTIALCVVWGLMLLQIIAKLPEVPTTLLIGSLFFPVYYFVLSLILQSRRVRRP
jgi:phosphatidylcholine synthase